MIQASIEAGIPANPDFNGAKQEGVGYYQTTTGNRARWSAAKAYLYPARHRPNLTIVTNAHATRILIEDGRAVGIEYRMPDHLFTVRCRGEIIVSGGVYGSPQLLQLSGLGPAALLQEFGIPVLRNMPGVGSHLHDHFNMGREVGAVVDPRLRVYGIQGLRVADASIMPQVPGDNTNAPSIMIGEKCAHMILEDARAA